MTSEKGSSWERNGADSGQRIDGGRETEGRPGTEERWGDEERRISEGRQGGEVRRYPISEGESPSEVVSLAVLDGEADDGRPAAEDLRPMVENQRPLYEVVDPEALDSLFETRPDHERSVGRVHFTYEGHEVVVRGGDEVIVRDAVSD